MTNTKQGARGLADRMPGKQDDEADLNARRYLRYLFDRFVERADGEEIQDMLAVFRYWVREEASMLPEDKAEVDLVYMALAEVKRERHAA